jgi:nitrous-oxide reductase
MKQIFKISTGFIIIVMAFTSCNNGNSKSNSALSSSAAEKVYVAPGEYDEFYAFISGGFSGQLSVYGLPSGRLFKVIPVFSQDAEKAWGYNEETKPMLNTSHGFIPWDDSHHPDISQTKGVVDGRYVYINANNTPRIAKIDLTTFETTEIIEIPNSAGNHSSSFVTENTEYVVAGTRFSIPIPQRDMSIKDYKGNFKGALSFLKINPDNGEMAIKFQLLMPGFDYDLSHPGRGKSHGWFFFTTYNTEEANSLLEVNASQNDKDFIAAINWKKIEEYVNSGGGTKMPTNYAHNLYSDETHSATSTMINEVLTVNPSEVPGGIYFLPTPKSPHGCDVDPTGEYIVGNGKLSAN